MQSVPRNNGFSLFELVVVIALISVLLVVAFWRLAGYIREAERVAVLTMEGEIRNVLLLEMAKRILNPDGPTVLALANSNPMDLMLEPPFNYLGELDATQSPVVPRRHWFYDKQSHKLVYRSDPDSITGGPQDISYDIEIAFTDNDGDGDYGAAHDRLLGVRLHRTGGVGWLNPSSRQADDLGYNKRPLKVARPKG